ncbi:schwannomin-interacting protein 1 isoform X2 [Lepisosteus oculatus]|uniref:schwannomin-interacting protein 1 isoform X2 n=1 Tax=Lepisosteus oculatus TaxID=7918 RepID=UPI00073FB50C|nr:PREDICTED: schwannomin-interacting protein 1-like isoform X2 [Lepisosteus oculatus]
MMEPQSEGEKERESTWGEEKDYDEAENSDQAATEPALTWGKGSMEDDLGLPIMHWEALNQRITELEKQQEESRAKPAGVQERGAVAAGWAEERERGSVRESWREEDEDKDSSRLIALTSRLQSRMNLQLCFINNSESEEEEEEGESALGSSGCGLMQKASPPAQAAGSEWSERRAELRREAQVALSTLRERLKPSCTAQKEPTAGLSEGLGVKKRRRLERSDLQPLSLQQLDNLRETLSQAIQDLSSELVGLLLTRDQLRTEQDAMLLEVQDMTSF